MIPYRSKQLSSPKIHTYVPSVREARVYGTTSWILWCQPPYIGLLNAIEDATLLQTPKAYFSLSANFFTYERNANWHHLNVRNSLTLQIL